MNKNYNLERKKLILPEYGRHIHEMIDFLSTIEDRDLRNQQTQAVIAVMGNLMPTLRDTADFAHKLWDHLFMMSNFELDVDSPYPTPSIDILAPTPEKINYPDKRIKMKHYGKNVEHIIEMLIEIKDKDKAFFEASIVSLVKYMQVKSFEYNLEHPNDDHIISDIQRLSNGRLTVEKSMLEKISSEQRQQQGQGQQPRRAGRGGGRGGRGSGSGSERGSGRNQQRRGGGGGQQGGGKR